MPESDRRGRERPKDGCQVDAEKPVDGYGSLTLRMKVEGGYLYNVIVMDVGRVGPCEVLKLRNVRPGSEMKRPSDEAARRSAVIDKVKS